MRLRKGYVPTWQEINDCNHVRQRVLAMKRRVKSSLWAEDCKDPETMKLAMPLLGSVSMLLRDAGITPDMDEAAVKKALDAHAVKMWNACKEGPSV